MRKQLCLLAFVCALGLSPPVGAQTSGTITSTSSSTNCPSLDASRMATVSLSVSGTWTGTLTPKIAVGGQPPQTTQVTPANSSTAQTSITANNVYYTAGGGIISLCGPTSTGTANVFLQPIPGSASRGGGVSGSSFPVASAQTVSTGGSISPDSGSGQIIGTQDWWSAGPIAPTVTMNVGGGSIGAAKFVSAQVTFINSAGETLASTEGFTPTNCGAGSCSATLTAPTLPLGYTGYSVYACTDTTETCTTKKVLACVNITSNCTITNDGTGGSVPSSNTAYLTPSPLGTNNCSPATTPWLYTYDTSTATWFSYAGVDSYNTGSNPPAPYNKLSFCRPIWLNDTQTDPPAGRNSLFSLYHIQNGSTTNTGNQDRGQFIYTSNCLPTSTCSDSSTHYGLEGIQVEQDLNGTPTINGSPDGEVTAVSAQLADYHTGTIATPNAFGVNGIRSTYSRTGAGNYSGNAHPTAGIFSQALNNTTSSGGSNFMQAYIGDCDEGTGSPSNIFCVNYYAAFTGTFNGQWGFWSNDSGSCTNCYDSEFEATNENQGKNAFAGTSFFSHVSAGNLSGRIAFTNPTCSATGVGTGSCAIRTGSSDSLGRMVLTVSGGTGAGTGTATLTFHVTWGSPNTDVSCTFQAENGSGSWSGIVGLVVSSHSTSAVTVSWTDGTLPTALPNGTYDLNYTCWGN